MNYREICIELPTEHSEPVIELLWARELSYQELDQSTLNPPPPGRTRLQLYVPDEETDGIEGLLTAVHELVPDVAALQIELRDRDDAEWRDTWKQFFATRRLGRIAIVPSWEAAAHKPEAGEVTLHLDPGRAFGTGGHASTRLCLRLLDGLAQPGQKGEGSAPVAVARLTQPSDSPQVLDVGCGCGVLAIAAVLLWPTCRAIGIDIDPESIEVTDENSERNQVRERLLAATTPLSEISGEFALVLANLTGPTLLELADEICARVLPGGVLILSGILQTEAAAVSARFCALGLIEQQHETEEEWSALKLLRPVA